MIDWKSVKHFSPNENWGDVEKIEPQLIYKLERFRDVIGRPFVLHNAFSYAGHSNKSQHYLGRAGDGHVEGVDLLDMFLVAEKLEFNGIGLYDWGIHLDVRIADTPARWCRIDGVYLPLTAKNIDHLRQNYKYK